MRSSRYDWRSEDRHGSWRPIYFTLQHSPISHPISHPIMTHQLTPITPITPFKQCELMRSETRPDVSCDTPEDSFPRTNFNIEGVVAPPPGWRREVIPRKTVNGADAYYYSPCGKRMRSKPDVQRFLDKCKERGKYVDVGIESFDFHTGGRGDAKKDGKKAEKSDEKPAKREKADDDGDDDKESSKKKQKGGTSKGDTKQKEDIPVKRGRGRPKRVMEAVKEKEEEKEDVDMADA